MSWMWLACARRAALGVCLLSPGILAADALPAHAGTATRDGREAAAVKSRKSFSRNFDANCNTVVCEIAAYTVPKKAQLELSYVSCWASISSPGAVLLLELQVPEANLIDYVTLKALGEFAGHDFGSGDRQISTIATAGQSVKFHAEASTAMSQLKCRLDGTLVKFW